MIFLYDKLILLVNVSRLDESTAELLKQLEVEGEFESVEYSQLAAEGDFFSVEPLEMLVLAKSVAV